MSECGVMMLFCMGVNFSFPLRWPMFCAPLEQYFHLNSLQAFVQRRNETLAPAYAHALQGFCTFCFHNLHTSPICTSLFCLEIKELSSKMSDFFPLFSDVFPHISDISLKTPTFPFFSPQTIGDVLACSSSLFRLFSASFQSLNLYTLKICLKTCGNKQINSHL